MPVPHQIGLPAWGLADADPFIILREKSSVPRSLPLLPSGVKAVEGVHQNHLDLGMFHAQLEQHLSGQGVETDCAAHTVINDSLREQKPHLLLECRLQRSLQAVWNVPVAGTKEKSIYGLSKMPQLGTLKKTLYGLGAH